MDEIIYKVYAKVNEKGCIVDVESTAFHDEQKLIDDGFVKIDEGSDGRIYGHAQPNYLFMKYGQPKIDETNRLNYKLVGTTPILLSDEEKQSLNPPVELQPTEQEQINAYLMKQIALLKVGA